MTSWKLVLLAVVVSGLSACQSTEDLVLVPPGENIDNYCIGGTLSGTACPDEAAVRRCEENGGSCVPTQAAPLPPDYDQVGDDCKCTCINLWGPNRSACREQLQTSCELASNCNKDDCGIDSCTWTGVQCPRKDEPEPE